MAVTRAAGGERARLAPRLLGGLLVAISLYYAVWGGEYSAFDLRRLRQRQHDAAAALAASQQQVDSLRRVAELLESDPATLEAVARERFGMIRDGELLYRFVNVGSPPPLAQAEPAVP